MSTTTKLKSITILESEYGIDLFIYLRNRRLSLATISIDGMLTGGRIFRRNFSTELEDE